MLPVGQLTASSSVVVPLFWGVQLCPPLADAMIVPPTPTAVHAEPTHDTPNRALVVPLVATVQNDMQGEVGQSISFVGVVTTLDGDGVIDHVEWDFDYDGTTFHPDSGATTLSPEHTFDLPGDYLVALRVSPLCRSDRRANSRPRARCGSGQFRDRD